MDWAVVRDTLKSVNMGWHEPEQHQRAFENSYAVVFVFDGEQLIGFGRAISDGAYQAGVYDVAVVSEWQGKGIGKTIMELLLEELAGCNVLLYATPGKELFYEKLGFSRTQTGMAKFLDPEKMRSRGFI